MFDTFTNQQIGEIFFKLFIFDHAALLIYVTYKVIIRFLPKWWKIEK